MPIIRPPSGKTDGDPLDALFDAGSEALRRRRLELSGDQVNEARRARTWLWTIAAGGAVAILAAAAWWFL